MRFPNIEREPNVESRLHALGDPQLVSRPVGGWSLRQVNRRGPRSRSVVERYRASVLARRAATPHAITSCAGPRRKYCTISVRYC